jgi:hypothetical protein
VPDDGDVEPPCRENQLESYDAMLLAAMMMQQDSAGRGGVVPPEVDQVGGRTRPLYDWFVSALSVAPLCDALLGFIDRLAVWNQSNRRSRRPARTRRTASSESPLDLPALRELRV